MGERIEMVVNSYIWSLNTIKICIIEKLSAAWPLEVGRHAGSNFRRICIKIAVGDRH